MHIILGGNGHVGSATARSLLASGEAVTIVSRNAARREEWEQRGAKLAVADIHDVDALRAVLRQGSRALLLNPPADPATDTDVEESETVRAILAALEGSTLDYVVAESTMGAQPGTRMGDLGVLYALEQGLARQAIPATIIRAAYYMSNWDAQLANVRDQGRLDTLLPPALALPMVAPEDLGKEIARLLVDPAQQHEVVPVEGPARYSANDVAAAFAHAVGRHIDLWVTPRDGWIDAFRKLGFSQPAAESYARMTAATVDADFDPPSRSRLGQTSLQAYIDRLVAGGGTPP